MYYSVQMCLKKLGLGGPWRRYSFSNLLVTSLGISFLICEAEAELGDFPEDTLM